MLDSQGRPLYPGSGTANEEGERPVIIFLSFPNRGDRYRKAAETMRGFGFTVLTNFDRISVKSVDRRSDLRLARIRQSNAYIHFAAEDPQGEWSAVRQVEFGYALGLPVPVAFVGPPVNSYHRYGDVFADIDQFLSAFAGSAMAEWKSHREGSASVA